MVGMSEHHSVSLLRSSYFSAKCQLLASSGMSECLLLTEIKALSCGLLFPSLTYGSLPQGDITRDG